MKDVFALDVGSGTQDALVADESLSFKAKLVLPAPTQLFALKIRHSKKDVFCDGYTMGGGAISGALIRHAEKHRVVMTPDAARTVRDDPEQVRERGIEIGKKMDGDCLRLTLKDVDMGAFRESLSLLGYSLPKPDKMVVAIAVQDHGVAPKGRSDREFRFETIGRKIKKGATFRDFIFTKKAPGFSRVSAVLQSLYDEGYEDSLVMDTKIAGIFGALYGMPLPAIAMDIGNGHTTAASVLADGTIAGVFEHHTSSLTPSKMRDYIERLADATLKNEEIFDDGGHGAYVKEPVKPKAIVISGPRRRNIEKAGLDVQYAMPLDDVYMVGPVGMIRAYQEMKKG